MNPTTSQPWHGLLERIIASLERGGRITAPVLDYIEASLFTPDSDRLCQFLTDDNDSERDSLLDLIFYPDEAFQLALEPLLGASRCSAGDEVAIRDRLLAEPIDAVVRLPDNRPLVRIRLPGFIKSRFLTRLNIAWPMDPEVAAAIDAGVSPTLQLVVKVRLRNAALVFTAHRQRFLGHFFERMADRSPDYLDCLDLVLPLLASAKTDTDAYELLVQRKRSLFRSLQQARRFEVILGQSNMETLMLQGVRPPTVSCDELQREMRLIDLICVGTYGITEAMSPALEEPLRQVSNLETPEAVVKSLLR